MPIGFLHQPKPVKKASTIHGVSPMDYSKIEPNDEIMISIRLYLYRRIG